MTIRQLRRKRILERDGTAVELSLDEVDVVARGRVVGRFVELEAELRQGRRGRGSTRSRPSSRATTGLAPADRPSSSPR